MAAEERKMTVTQLRELADDNAQLMPLSVRQYHRMIKAGLIEEGAPYELLDGILVRQQRHAIGEDPMTIGDEHSWVVGKLMRLAPKLERLGCHIRIQQPITIPQYDEPEPDAAIIRGAIEDYAGRHPGPKDVLCVMEVADASIRRDRTIKRRIYADAAIPLYLIFDLTGRCVEVRSQPVKGKGNYADTAVLTRKEKLALPTGTTQKLVVPVKQIMP
jgi:Uma2 family endonuclease